MFKTVQECSEMIRILKRENDQKMTENDQTSRKEIQKWSKMSKKVGRKLEMSTNV